MGGRRRIGVVLAIVGIIVLLLGVFIVAAMFRNFITPPPALTQPPPLTEPVVVTTHAIDVGVVLRLEDLAQVEVPVELVPRGALSEVEQAAGRITKIPLIAGEMVMPHHLADPTNVTGDQGFVIGDDKVLMAFPATDLMSRLNVIKRGDLVDVLVSVEEPIMPEDQVAAQGEQQNQQEKELFTFDALQRVEISAFVVDILPARDTTGGAAAAAPVAEGTPQPTPTPSVSQIEPQALLLALSPQDALVLKHLKDAGAMVDIVLRSPTSSQLFELDPVMSQYLIDRYELKIAK